MSDFIPVNEPLLVGNEKKYLSQCIDSGWISSEGPMVQEFESKLAERVGRRFGVAVSNGTAAIDIAVNALDIKQGDEVIVPTFTIISCLQQLVRIGAKPVLVDSHPDYWGMNPEMIEEKITEKTVAIMMVHIYGLPVDVDPILEIARRHNIIVIEDAAEMHGQTYRGAPCGSFGQLSIFSFYPNKHITTGEGGMILTDDEELANRCRSLRNLCFQPSRRFVHDELGWNYRMSNLHAAVGLAQLEQLDYFVGIKHRMGELYTELLSDVAELQLPVARTEYAQNIYWVYGLVLRDSSKMSALEIMTLLGGEGIGCRPFFYPMHLQPVFRRNGLFEDETHPVAERLYTNGFYLPSGLKLTENQIHRVAKTVKKILQ